MKNDDRDWNQEEPEARRVEGFAPRYNMTLHLYIKCDCNTKTQISVSKPDMLRDRLHADMCIQYTTHFLDT